MSLTENGKHKNFGRWIVSSADLWYNDVGDKMDKGKELPKRKDIRLKNYDYSSPGAYFVTICTENRKNYFWNGSIDPQVFDWHSVGANCVRPQNLPLSDIGNIVLDELERWNQTYPAVSLYSYVIMPNHLHIMVIISADEYGRPQCIV